MHVGMQHGDTDAILRACAAFGVNNICGALPSGKLDEAWSVDSLSQLRERVATGRARFDALCHARDAALTARMERAGQQFRLAAGSLDAMSPLKVLERGYAIAQDATSAEVAT